MIGTSQPKRLLVLCTTTGYQTCAFIEAAQKLGLSITFGTDRCHVLDDPWQDGALPLRFEDPEASAQRICDFAASHPLDAIVSVGDRPTSTGARACHKLGLRGILQKRPTSAAISTVRASGCGMPGWRFRPSGDFPCTRTRTRLLPLGKSPFPACS